MEEFALDIIIGKGTAARYVRIPVPRITIIGATTRIALLSAPLRDRFGMILRLDPYDMDSMEAIVTRSAKLINLPLTKGAIKEIAKRSRSTPRIANRILKRVRDMFDFQSHTEIDEKKAKELFEILEIDEKGLNDLDSIYLKILIEKFDGGPVGLTTMAMAIGEDKKTLEEYIEPYLIQLGLLKKTPAGRVATMSAQNHFEKLTSIATKIDI